MPDQGYMGGMRDLDDVERENELRDQGYMDAAAAPVPDGGDDTLRDRLAEAITERLFRGGEYNSITIGRYTSLPLSLADALLPLIREHVAAAVQGERERADRLVSWKDTGFRERDKWRVRAETAEAEVERLRNVISMAEAGGMQILAERNEAQAAIERVRAVLGDAHEVIDRGGIRREAYIPADRVRAALDDQEATDGGAP